MKATPRSPYGFGENNVSPWGLGQGDEQKIANERAYEAANPGQIPGEGLHLNFGYAKRDPNSVGMGLFNKGLESFGGLQGNAGDVANQILQSANTPYKSAAQSQFQSGLDQSLRGAMALGQSQPGGGGMGALRSILEAQGGMSGQANAQASQLAAQEQQRDIMRQLQAREAAGGIYGSLANQQLQATQLGAGMSEQDRDALMRMEAMRAGVYSSGESARMGKDQFGTQMGMNLIGSGLGSASSLIGAGAFSGKGKAQGGMIRGHDSEQYDKVPAMLSPGEVVLPRSVTQSEHPENRAAEFVKHVRKSKGGKLAKGGKVDSSYSGALAKVKQLKEQILELEKHLA